mmetsp:Transcript_118561/g.206428  ORF Transcript_118561/g.206428 Transcript_118561/m.206428 type:complete len:302 (-) Transcript_118561:10641-11546(-)
MAIGDLARGLDIVQMALVGGQERQLDGTLFTFGDGPDLRVDGHEPGGGGGPLEIEVVAAGVGEDDGLHCSVVDVHLPKIDAVGDARLQDQAVVLRGHQHVLVHLVPLPLYVACQERRLLLHAADQVVVVALLCSGRERHLHVDVTVCRHSACHRVQTDHGASLGVHVHHLVEGKGVRDILLVLNGDRLAGLGPQEHRIEIQPRLVKVHVRLDGLAHDQEGNAGLAGDVELVEALLDVQRLWDVVEDHLVLLAGVDHTPAGVAVEQGGGGAVASLVHPLELVRHVGGVEDVEALGVPDANAP